MGEKFLDQQFAGDASKSGTTHYDPRTNHCYGDVEIKGNKDGYFHYSRALYDLQTGELLAQAQMSQKSGALERKPGVVGSHYSSFSEAIEYIEKMLKQDR